MLLVWCLSQNSGSASALKQLKMSVQLTTQRCVQELFLGMSWRALQVSNPFRSFVLLVLPQCEVSEITQCSTQEYGVRLRDLET